MDRFFGSRQCQRQRPARRLALAIGLGSLLAASATGWAGGARDSGRVPGPDETFGVAGPAAPKALKPVRPTPSERMGIALGTLPEVRLPAVDRDALLREDAVAQRSAPEKGARYSLGRTLQVSVADGHWYDLADGSRLWAGEVVSPDALGLRLHFQDVHLPAGAELAIYSPERPSPGVAKNGYPRFDPDRKVEFHQGSAAQRAEFWTASFPGDRARVEYLAPAGAAVADGLPFTLDWLQHVYLDPVAQLAKSLLRGKAAGACENDVTCDPNWADVARAVSAIGTIGQGHNGVFCSGQLLNTQAQDFTPYWLTANHCLSSQADAASSEFYWLYQTSTCNGAPPAFSSVPSSLGATLVSTNLASDYTLLLINGALPDGLFFAGWTGQQVPDGTDAVGVHHPAADYKRISYGTKENNAGCYSFQGTNGRSLVEIGWNNGVTEPGSSGSGIFRADTQQLFGQLFFGPSSCSAGPADRFDCYGAFFTTYTRIKNFLKAGSDDNSEQNDSCARARVVRAGALRGRIVKGVDPDWYKILVPAHKTVTVRLDFANANGDIDLAAYGSCGSDPLATSTSTDDSETVSFTNNGNQPAFGLWQVYLSSSTRNSYNMAVSLH
jgi:lysyl endopeptidase